MTCIYVDSCAAYPSSTDALTAGWTTGGTGYGATSGRWSTGALGFSQTTGLSRNAAIGASGTVGFVLALSVSSAINPFFYLREGATIHLDFRLNALGQVIVTRNGTLLGTSSATSVVGAHTVIQIKFTIHDSTGAVEVWMNDNLEISLTGQDTRNAGTAGTIDNVQWGGGGGAAYSGTASEIYINTSAGSAPNNGVWGSYRIQAKRMSAAGNSAQFTPSASTNVSNVDDAQGHDSDTTYNSSSTAGHIDLFQTSQITPTGGTIPAIMHRIVARKDDAGVRTIRPKQRQAGTNYNGTSQNITTAYAHYTEVVATNPATAAAFTVAEMRATDPEFGYELVA